MAWHLISVDNVVTIFQNSYSQGFITQNCFAFYLTRVIGQAGNVLTLGGYNSAYSKNDWKTVLLITQIY